MKCAYIGLNSVVTKSLPHVVRVCETQAHLMSVAIIKRVSNGLLVQGQGKHYDNPHYIVYGI